MEQDKFGMYHFPNVTRFEVIDNNGRIYIENNKGISFSIQDDGKTLKVFVDGIIKK